MNRFPTLSAAFLFTTLTMLPAAAQQAAPPPPITVVAAQGAPNLKLFPPISLGLSNERVPLHLNIATQTSDGRFAGEAVRPGSVTGLVTGLIEATDTGGYMVEFTIDTKGAPQKLFQGSVFVAEANGRVPQKVSLSGIYSLMEGDKTTGGPFPFSGAAYARRAVGLAAPAAGGGGVAVPANPGGGAVLSLNQPSDGVSGSSILRRNPRLLLSRIRGHVAASAQPANVMEALERRVNMKTFVSLVKAAGLEDTYRKVQITVFAPNDEAFGRLPAGTLDTLRKNQASAKQYINYCTSYQHKYLTKGSAGEGLPGNEVNVGTGRLGVSQSNGRIWIMGNDSRRAPVMEESIDAGLGALYVTGVVLIQKSVRFD